MAKARAFRLKAAATLVPLEAMDIEALRYRKADALAESTSYGEITGRMCENCTLGFQFCS